MPIDASVRQRRTARIPDRAAAILFQPTAMPAGVDQQRQFDVRLAVRARMPYRRPCRQGSRSRDRKPRNRGRRKPLAFSAAPPGMIAAPTLPRVPVDVRHHRKPDAPRAVSPLPGLSRDLERTEAPRRYIVKSGTSGVLAQHAPLRHEPRIPQEEKQQRRDDDARNRHLSAHDLAAVRQDIGVDHADQKRRQ
jgi:hypothetical protein